MQRKLSFVIAIFPIFAAMPARAESRFERRARERQETISKITLPYQEPIEFQLRRGVRRTEDMIDTYEAQHGPQVVQSMFDAGLRFSRLHFYKGMGLALEMPDIRRTREVAERMHKLGMKVSLYIGGTMFIETFYREVPEAREWEARDQWNRPVYYIETQTFRHFACFNEPAYLDYLKRVIRVAVDDVKADQIFFDNVFLQPEPKSDRCPRCIRALHQFLKERYPTREAAFRRFGFPDTDWLVVNDWDIFNDPGNLISIDDPVLQEWTRFRSLTVARHCADLYDFIKSLNPKISVGFNLKGLYGMNRMWRNGVYHPLVAGKLDFSCFDVGGMNAHLDPRTGALIAEIRSYKMARTLGFSYESGGGPLEKAVMMAFNPMKYVAGYGWQGVPGTHEEDPRSSNSAESEFFREYADRYYTATEGVADVAVLRTWPSMAFSITATSIPTVLMEQTLIQHKVPFDIIFDEQMDKIARYRAIILPGQESLSQAWLDKLLAYARNGGTVVLTGNTAEYNEWRERRKTNPLRSRMAGAAVVALGKGRLVYIPEIVPGAKPQGGMAGVAGDETAASASPARADSFAASAWVLPKNHQAIRDAIVNNLSQPLTATADAPLDTAMEIVNRPSTHQILLHFVNFDGARATTPFGVRLQAQYPGRRAASVECLTPESDNAQKLDFTERGGEIAFTSPALKRYSMIVVSFR
jgi:hypothetical protein